MFSYYSQILNNKETKYSISKEGKVLTYNEVIHLWKTSEPFRQFYIQILKDNPFEGYFWEHPPIKKETVNQDYEFVLVKADVFLRLSPHEDTFSQYFRKQPNESVISFPNIGRNAHLVVPAPQSESTNYIHIGHFFRADLLTQQSTFLQKVGKQMTMHINPNPLWLSTSGLGVYWLHARLDQRPKYYTFKAYKTL